MYVYASLNNSTDPVLSAKKTKFMHIYINLWQINGVLFWNFYLIKHINSWNGFIICGVYFNIPNIKSCLFNR